MEAASFRNGSNLEILPRAHVFRCSPNYGLKSDIAGGPFGASSGLMQRSELMCRF
jgi:hypothetical protein